MAEKQKPKKAPKVQASPPEESVLKTTAKVIGSAAGKIASMAGLAETGAPRAKSGKLQKSHKPHLPRKLKKAQKKAALAESHS